VLSAATAQCSQVECYGNNSSDTKSTPQHNIEFDGNVWLLHVAEIVHSKLHAAKAKHLQVTQSDM